MGGSATLLQGGTNTVKFQSFIDQNNGQNTIQGPGILAAPSQTFHTSGFFASPPKSLPITALQHPYSITETLQITLAPFSSLSFSSSTTFLVPEPSSMAIAGLGMLGMIGYGVRRRWTA